MAAHRLPEAAMERYGLNLDHPDILKAILMGILENGDAVAQEGGRTVLTLTVDDWLMDELAVVGVDEREDELAA
jgi:hypothetical protein